MIKLPGIEPDNTKLAVVIGARKRGEKLSVVLPAKSVVTLALK